MSSEITSQLAGVCDELNVQIDRIEQMFVKLKPFVPAWVIIDDHEEEDMKTKIGVMKIAGTWRLVSNCDPEFIDKPLRDCGVLTKNKVTPAILKQLAEQVDANKTKLLAELEEKEVELAKFEL
jgi:hypothetical protein